MDVLNVGNNILTNINSINIEGLSIDCRKVLFYMNNKAKIRKQYAPYLFFYRIIIILNLYLLEQFMNIS